MSLLTAHVLNGQVVGTQLTNYSVITTPFKIESTPSLGYVDISSVVNWWDFGRDLDKDYSYVRREIKALVDQKGIDSVISTISTPPGSPADGDKHYIDPLATATGDWAGYEGYIAKYDLGNTLWIKEPPCHEGYRLCTTAEKDICAELKIGSSADHFADYGVPAIVDYGVEYHRQSILAREERLLRAQVEIYNRLPINAFTILTDLIASPIGDLTELYAKYGLKGSVEDYNIDYNPTPAPGICDYLLARAPFDGNEPYVSAGYANGLKNKGWTPIDATTLNDFADEIYNIIVYGDAAGS